MSYSTTKAPVTGNQEQGTGTGKRKVTAPGSASNQLRITTPDVLKDARQHQSHILLPAVSNPSGAQPTYGKKSPATRPVGKGQR